MSKEKTKAKDNSSHCLPLYGIYGIMVLFVLTSITYSTYMVAVGTDGFIPKVMLIPQALFAGWIAVYKFHKS
jgi:hypothetical protein